MNFNFSEFGNFSRPSDFNHHRQGKFLGPLIGFFLASIFPNLAIARLQPGSIRFQYDPIPNNPVINIYQTTQKPVQQSNSTPHHEHPPVVFSHKPHYPQQHHLEPIEENVNFPTSFSTSLESPYEFLVPPEPPKSLVKRAISSRYNRFTATNNRKRFPEYDYYDYPSRIKNTNIRRRNQGRRPLFDYEYEFLYDYDYGKGKKRKQQQQQKNRRNNKTKPNKRDPDYYDNNDYDDDDDVERVTSFKPRQQQQQDTTTTPTTTMQTTTMPTTIIQNGSTPSTPKNDTSMGYGYGPYSGNENVSITYGPPSPTKPIYGVPGYSYGSPISEWVPNSYLYESPISTSYVYPSSVSYGLPSSSSSYSSVSYASPSYSKPAASYGPPSTSYGVPSTSYGVPSHSYGVPSQTYGVPSTSYGVPSTSYGVPSQSYGTPSQSYGLPSTQAPSSTQTSSRVVYQGQPFSSWLGRSGSQINRVQDLF